MSWVCSLGASSLLASYNALGFWYLVSSTSKSRSQQTWSYALAGNVGEHWFPVQNSHTSFTEDRTHFPCLSATLNTTQHVRLSRECEKKYSFLNLYFHNFVQFYYLFNNILLNQSYFLCSIILMGLLKNRLSVTGVDHVRQIVILFSAPAHARETFKEGAQKHVNNANNDLMEDLTIFEPTAANVSAFVGHTAYLPCRVRNLGDKVVSPLLF